MHVGLNHSLLQNTDKMPQGSPEEKLNLLSAPSSDISQLRARNVAFYYLYMKQHPGVQHTQRLPFPTAGGGRPCRGPSLPSPCKRLAPHTLLVHVLVDK